MANVAPLLPYSGPFDSPELLHLLRRTLFGVSKADLNFFKNKSLNEVVDALLTFNNTVPPPIKYYGLRVNNLPDPSMLDTEVKYGETWVNTPINNQTNSPDGSRRESIKAWWMGLMIHQDRNLREQMVLFWHNHFSTEANEIGNSFYSYFTNVFLRKNLIGNFETFLNEITLDPGMLRYLNGYVNKKSAPDENYGRELQELFSVGKGPGSNYTEDDVKAAARLLTGWSITTTTKDAQGKTVNIIPKVSFNPANHDIADKKFSSFYNNTTIKSSATNDEAGAKKEITELIKMILATDEVSKFICRKLYTYFIYYEISPTVEVEFIEPLALIFKNSSYDIKTLLKAFFTSDHFFKPENRGCLIKDPLCFVISKVRQFGVVIPDATKFEAQYYFWSTFKNYARNMGQDILDPPNVAGWPAYYQTPSFHEMWIDTATYPERKVYYENLSKSGINSGTYYFDAANKSILIKEDHLGFVKSLDTPEDPNALIDQSVELLFGVPISQTVKDQLKTSFLLQGQVSDHYWTDAYLLYVSNPSTTDPAAKKVPTILRDLFLDMQSAAEFHLC